jgi:hypothetical protein
MESGNKQAPSYYETPVEKRGSRTRGAIYVRRGHVMEGSLSLNG